MTPEQLKIVERVQKLLALAGNNPNEAEAESATQKAMDLLSAYNLSMHSVNNHSKANGDGKRDDKKRSGGLYAWQRSLWESVAKLNFCMYWSIKGLTAGSKYEHRLLGSEVNVISTEVMAEYLQKTVERIAQTWAKERDKNVFCRDAIAFREGMAAAIASRLEALREQRLREERERPASNGTELVLADVIHAEEDFNTDYINGWEPGTAARMRAERNAERAAAMQRYREQEAEHQRKMETDPEYAKRHAEQQAKNEEWWAKHRAEANKKAEQAERRRMKNAGKPGYDDLGYKIQYRQMTAQEHRQSLSAFSHGVDAGRKVNLDKQVDKAAPKGRIK